MKKDIMQLDPFDLLEYLQTETTVTIPTQLETVDDMRAAGELLGRCASLYSWLAALAMQAKLLKKSAKHNGDKDAFETALSREEVFNTFADLTKMNYQAISRMLTIKTQINEELKMTDAR